MISVKRILAAATMVVVIGLNVLKSAAYMQTPLEPINTIETVAYEAVEPINIELNVEEPVEEVIEMVEIEEPVEEVIEAVEIEEPVEEVIEVEPIPIEPEVATESNASTSLILSEDDIQLIAWVTMAEAEGEPVEGKRLVIDTLLNRIEDDGFPNSAHGVVYQKGQFEAMWNGRSDRCNATDEILQMVREEMVNRTDSRVLWFRSGHYHTFGTPVRSVGNHYFSTY